MANPFSTDALMGFSIAKVHPYDLTTDHANELVAQHAKNDKDYKAIGSAHWSLGTRHAELSNSLAKQAQMMRDDNGGSDNTASRAYDEASVAHRDAMQRHYDAGNLNDSCAYSNDKVQGAAPNPNPVGGNALYATKASAAASKHADDLTKKAETAKSPMPLTFKSR